MQFIPYTGMQHLQPSSGDAKVPTGFPSPAMEFMEERITLDKIVVENPLSTYFAYNEGEAMTEAGIFPGSILVVDKALNARSGDIVIVFINGEYIARYIKMSMNKCTLWAANKKVQPIEVTEEMEMVVWGVVVSVVTDSKTIKLCTRW